MGHKFGITKDMSEIVCLDDTLSPFAQIAILSGYAREMRHALDTIERKIERLEEEICQREG